MTIKQFTKQGFIYSLGFILSRLQVFLLLPILVNCLTPKEYGIYETLTTIIVLSTTLCVFNLDSSLSSFFQKSNNQQEKQQLASTGLIIIVCWICILTTFVFFTKQYLTKLIFNFEIPSVTFFKTFLIGGLQGLIHYLNILLRQKFQPIRYNVLVFVQTLPLLLAVAFYYQQGLLNLNLVLDIFLSVNLLALITGIFLNADILKATINKLLIRPLLNIAIPLLPFSLFAWGLSLSDRILLNQSLGIEQVAIYAFANRIASIGNILQGPFQIAWPPYALKLMAEKKESNFFPKAITLFILVMGLFTVLLGTLSPFLFQLMAPPEYIESAKFVGALAFCTMLNTLYYFPLTVFLHQNKTWASTVSFFLAAIINILTNLIITPKVGIIGAVYANLFSYIALTVTAFTLSHHFQKINFFYRKNLSYLLFVFIIILWLFLY